MNSAAFCCPEAARRSLTDALTCGVDLSTIANVATASTVLTAVIFGVINGLIGPIVKLLALPLTLMTMGLIGFVINAALLLATAFVSKTLGFTLQVGDYPPDFTADTFIAAIVGAVVLSLISSAILLVVRD